MSKLTDESAVEKAFRLLDEIEASVADESDPLAKADALMDKALRRDEDQTADLTLIPTRYIRDFAKSLGIEPGSPDAITKLRKKATRRDVERFLATPVPPKCAGAGIPHLPIEKVEQMAKARGYGMPQEDWKRGLA